VIGHCIGGAHHTGFGALAARGSSRRRILCRCHSTSDGVSTRGIPTQSSRLTFLFSALRSQIALLAGLPALV